MTAAVDSKRRQDLALDDGRSGAEDEALYLVGVHQPPRGAEEVALMAIMVSGVFLCNGGPEGAGRLASPHHTRRSVQAFILLREQPEKSTEQRGIPRGRGCP